jgi:type VI secretion system protein ImpF
MSNKLHPAIRDLPSQRFEKGELKKHPMRYLPTLFDRLRDDEPSKKTESPNDYAVNRSQMRLIVQRDLALLLNTINISDLVDPDLYPEVYRSTFNYGIPAFAGSYLSNKRWGDIESIIKTAIERYEPRLIPSSVQVRLINQTNPDNHYNILSFEIEALLHMEPYPMEFLVQSSIDLETNRLTIRDAA